MPRSEEELDERRRAMRELGKANRALGAVRGIKREPRKRKI